MNATSQKRVMFQPQVLCHCDDVLGEGPLWDHRSQQLLWIDIIRGYVHAWRPNNGVTELVHVDALIGSIALAGAADLLLATSKGLMKWNARSNNIELVVNPLANKPVRFNDGRVDAAGRFWVGTMALDPQKYGEPLGELYRIDADGSVHLAEESLTISNGLDWSPDGRSFYLTDTMRRRIYVYDFDAANGTISNRRTHIELGEDQGYPDGLVVDAIGHIWVAAFGGGGILRYDASGRLLQKIPMTVSCPTAIAFGGVDYSNAYITSSQHVLGVDHGEHDAGALFVAELDATGRRAAIFE